MAQVDRLRGLTGNAAIKVPCRVATTANITLTGEQTIDGVAAVTGDRVLVRSQTTQTENGIYVCDTGDWERSADFDGNLDVVEGTIVLVLHGSVYSNTYWKQATVGDIVIGTSNITFDAAIGSSSSAMSFLQAGTGAVSRTVQSKLRDIVCVLDFGATGDGVTDDAAAIQLAVTAAVVGGFDLYFPAGTYLIGTAISVTNALTIRGAGQYSTSIKLNSATMTGFNVTSAYSFQVQDMRFLGSVPLSAGECIKINGTGGGENTKSRFFNLLFSDVYQGIEFVAANTWIIDNCAFEGSVDASIVIANTVNADSGDNIISNSYFTGSAAGDSIRHLSSGGLRVSGCKFQANGTAYHMSWNSTTGSSQLTFVGNHIEPQSIGGFVFERVAASGGISGIVICGNRFAVSTAIPCIWFKTNDATFVAGVNMSGNYYNIDTSGIGIQIDGGGLFSLTGETIQGIAGTAVGVATGNATATAIQAQAMNFYSCGGGNYSINTSSQLGAAEFRGTKTGANMGTISDGGIYTTTMTVPGAAVGDIVYMGMSEFLGGAVLSGSVTSANTVTLTVYQKSGGNWVTSGSTTFNAVAYRRPTWSN